MNNNVFVSDNFNMDDIRRIRDDNSMRHSNMTPEEIIKDINIGADKMKKLLAEHKANKH